MAVGLTANFNQGTNTNTIATSDTGNENAFDGVTIGAGSTITYDNTHVNNGSLSAKFTQSGGRATIEWIYGTLTEVYGRVYLYRTANPSSKMQVVRVNSGSGSSNVAAFISVTTGGKIQCQDGASGSTVGATSISLNQFIRIEYHVVHSATVGVVEAKLFNTTTSTTPSETITLSSANTLTSADRVYQGSFSAITDAGFWLDNIIAGSPAYPGPLTSGTGWF